MQRPCLIGGGFLIKCDSSAMIYGVLAANEGRRCSIRREQPFGGPAGNEAHLCSLMVLCAMGQLDDPLESSRGPALQFFSWKFTVLLFR